MAFNIRDLQIPPPDDGTLFEKLCRDLYEAKFGEAQPYGTSGQAQQGVDIFILIKDIGIQCKKRALEGRITEKELQKEVEKAKKFKPPLKRFILAATCKRDAKIQKSARLISKDHKRKKLFSVEIHSWDEIKKLLEKHPSVFYEYYPGFKPPPHQVISPDLKSILSDSRHQELNRIRDLITNQPKTALELLEKFEKDKEHQLQGKEKYKVLTIKAWANMLIKRYREGAELFIKALQFNPKDENANANCAQAWLTIDNIEEAKKYIEKTKKLNPLNQQAHFIELWVKHKEAQSLDKIISGLPKSLKEDYQIARALFYIMIKRKQYQEAEKQLDIFYKKIKEQNQENIQEKIEWADMSLLLILKKEDIMPRTPDCLKNKLKEIIKIYKDFVTKPEYSELRRFNPVPYLDYAEALVLDENMNEAIHIFKDGIDLFPNDSRFKIKLAWLYFMQEKWEKNISFLEDLPELKKFIEPGSIDKTQQKAKPRSRLKNLFDLAVMLDGSYSRTQQNEKALRFLDKIIKSPVLNEHEKLILQQFRIFRHISLGKTDTAEKELDLLFKNKQNKTFHWILKSKIEGIKERSTAHKKEKKKSETHKKEKISCLKQALAVFNEEHKGKDKLEIEGSRSYEYLRDTEDLYKEFFNLKMYQSAEPLLERFTKKNLSHPAIFYLLYAYFENGKNKQAIGLAKALLEKFPNDGRFVNILFLIYESLGDIKTAVRYYEDFISSNPDNDVVRIELACAYIRNEDLEKAKKLLRKPLTNPLNEEQISRLSYTYMHTGGTKQALETQYRYIENNPSNFGAQMAYVNLVIFLNHPKSFDFEKSFDTADFKKRKHENKLILDPKVVGEDVFVRIQEIEILDGQEIVDEPKGITIEKQAPIHKPRHELSQALKGKKPGDIVLFNETKYKIMEIKSKYIHKCHEILKNMKTNFPSQHAIKQVRILKHTGINDLENPSLEEMKNPSPTQYSIKQSPIGEQTGINEFEKSLKKMFSNKKKQQDPFQLYREGKIPIGSIAEKLKKHPIEIMECLYFSKEDKFISSVPSWEKSGGEIQEILDKKNNIIIDLLSLIVIHQIKIEEYLEKSRFKFYICPSTVNSLKKYIEETALHLEDGLFMAGFDENDRLDTSFTPAEKIKQHLIIYKKIKTWAEKHCQIKNISPDIVLSRKERQKFERLIGKEFFDPILALYRDKNTVFLSEDAMLRVCMSSFYKKIDAFQASPAGPPIAGARVFDLIDRLKRDAVIDKNQAVQFKAGLVKCKQTYIPIDHNILFSLLREAEYVVSDIGVQRGLFFLGPVSNWAGAVAVATDFLLELCQSPSLMPYRKHLITKAVLDQVCFGRNKSSKETAYQIIALIRSKTQLLPVLQNEACKAVIEWLKHKVY